MLFGVDRDVTSSFAATLSMYGKGGLSWRLFSGTSPIRSITSYGYADDLPLPTRYAPVRFKFSRTAEQFTEFSSVFANSAKSAEHEQLN